MRLVFVGESMVEIAPNGAQFDKGFAGDTLNMAWYARHLAPQDWTIDFVTAVGQDAVSNEMIDFIDTAGVGTAHIFRDPDATVGLYLISLKNGERSFSYWRGQSAARQLADDPARLAVAFSGADLVCLSGITVAILDATGRATLAAALTAVQAAGGKVAFDPNIRPRLWRDPSEMTATITQFAGLSDIVLASFDDEQTFFGDNDIAATIKRYKSAGATDVIVKDGGNPTWGHKPNDQQSMTPAPVSDIIDSTAAGDSFNAAYLLHDLSGAPLQDSIRAGIDLSREVIQQAGALSVTAVAKGGRAV